MPPQDRLEFHTQVLEQMRAQRRRPFRRGVALDIALSTTAPTPTHIHNVAKNVLDLLGGLDRQGRRLGPGRPGLLYYDDAQVDALSVSSVRTTGTPHIDITAVSLHDFLEDLGLAARAELDYLEWHEARDDDGAIEKYADWRESNLTRSAAADKFNHFLQANAQRELLQPSRRYLWALAELFGAPTMPA